MCVLFWVPFQQQQQQHTHIHTEKERGGGRKRHREIPHKDRTFHTCEGRVQRGDTQDCRCLKLKDEHTIFLSNFQLGIQHVDIFWFFLARFPPKVKCVCTSCAGVEDQQAIVPESLPSWQGSIEGRVGHLFL